MGDGNAANGPVAESVARFAAGCNCAQAVFAPQAARHGLDADTATHVAAMFGGGIVRTGQMCGACSGGLLALGLAVAGREARPYGLGQEFLRRFAAARGSTTCRELLGCDLATPEGQAAFREQRLLQSVCVPAVETAARLVEELLPTRPGA